MRPSCRVPEPFHVSARFRVTLQLTILALEAAAAEDERAAALLEDADHRRRQGLLVAAQLERAFRLSELLERTAVRVDWAA